MSRHDQDIANELTEECGFGDEDLYAALPTPNADKLLRKRKVRASQQATVKEET